MALIENPKFKDCRFIYRWTAFRNGWHEYTRMAPFQCDRCNRAYNIGKKLRNIVNRISLEIEYWLDKISKR